MDEEGGGSVPDGDTSRGGTPDEDARRAAMDKALELLAFRARAESELSSRLRRAGHSPDAVAATIERCRELGYVDDAAFALAHVRDRLRLRPRGRRALRSELRRKGVALRVADEAIAEAFAEAELEETALAARLARKRARALEDLERSVARRRLAAYLARRGFPPDVVRETVAATLVEGEAESALPASPPTPRAD